MRLWLLSTFEMGKCKGGFLFVRARLGRQEEILENVAWMFCRPGLLPFVFELTEKALQTFQG